MRTSLSFRRRIGPVSGRSPSLSRPAPSASGSTSARSWLSVFVCILVPCVALVGLGSLIGCGLEPDGSHKDSASRGAAESADAASSIGRYRTEAIRLGVSRPLLILVDTATGMVQQRAILGAQRFRPVTEEPAPGADLEPKIPGRYDVKVVPGRRGSALLRLDSVTGDTWVAQLGGARSEWLLITSALNDVKQKQPPKALPNASTPAEEAGGRSAATGAAGGKKQPPVESLLEVVTQPEYENELRVWTAGFMAQLYPREAIDLLTSDLASKEPGVAVSIVEGLEFDAQGETRAALDRLRKHDVPGVAAAVNAKLDAKN